MRVLNSTVMELPLPLKEDRIMTSHLELSALGTYPDVGYKAKGLSEGRTLLWLLCPQLFAFFISGKYCSF